VEISGEKMGDLYVLPSLLVCSNTALPLEKTILVCHSPDSKLGTVSISSDVAKVSLRGVSTVGPGKTRLTVAVESPARRLPSQGTLRIVSSLHSEPLAAGLCITKD
jgi:hypothetical protein